MCLGWIDTPNTLTTTITFRHETDNSSALIANNSFITRRQTKMVANCANMDDPDSMDHHHPHVPYCNLEKITRSRLMPLLQTFNEDSLTDITFQKEML